MVQILLYTKDQATGVSWSLSPNCASHKQIAFHVEANKIYQESCALEIGKSYELNCDSFAENGWSGSFLVIENKAYCQNFQAGSRRTSKETKIKINGSHSDDEESNLDNIVIVKDLEALRTTCND